MLEFLRSLLLRCKSWKVLRGRALRRDALKGGHKREKGERNKTTICRHFFVPLKKTSNCVQSVMIVMLLSHYICREFRISYTSLF